MAEAELMKPVKSEKLLARPQKLNELDLFKGPITVYGADGKAKKSDITAIYLADLKTLGETRYQVYKKDGGLVFVEIEDTKRKGLIDAIDRFDKGDHSALDRIKEAIEIYIDVNFWRTIEGIKKTNPQLAEEMETTKFTYDCLYTVLSKIKKKIKIPELQLKVFSNMVRRNLIDLMNYSLDIKPNPKYGDFVGNFHSHPGVEGPSEADIRESKTVRAAEFVLSYDAVTQQLILFKSDKGNVPETLGKVKGNKQISDEFKTYHESAKLGLHFGPSERDPSKYVFTVTVNTNFGLAAIWQVAHKDLDFYELSGRNKVIKFVILPEEDFRALIIEKTGKVVPIYITKEKIAGYIKEFERKAR